MISVEQWGGSIGLWIGCNLKQHKINYQEIYKQSNYSHGKTLGRSLIDGSNFQKFFRVDRLSWLGQLLFSFVWQFS